MSSNNGSSKAPSGGNSKKSGKSPISQVPPKDRADQGSSKGRNKKVSEILSLVENLTLKELQEFRTGLAQLGVLGGSFGYHNSLSPGGPLPEPQVPVDTPTPSESGGVPLLDDKEPQKTGKGVGGSTEIPEDQGSGATRRTMIRKARKALKDSQGNAEGTERALARLRLLAEKYEKPLEEVLPEGYDLPAGSTADAAGDPSKK